MSTTLSLDATPGALVIGYILGDPWSRSVDYQEKVDGEYVAAAWPSAPVIEFPNADQADLTATLSTANAVANSRATWTLTEGQVTAMHAAVIGGSKSKATVRLSVDGITWFVGLVEKRA